VAQNGCGSRELQTLRHKCGRASDLPGDGETHAAPGISTTKLITRRWVQGVWVMQRMLDGNESLS
jgi:hypothetical protein